MLLRLTFSVVMVGGLCVSVKADGVSRAVSPRDYVVKLCGREFVRAVIFTCGGSRWRRSIEGGLVGNYKHTWQHGVERTGDRSPLQISSSSSLADLLALSVALGDRQPLSDHQLPLEEFHRSTILGEQHPSVSWPKPNRRKRNFSLGVAGMCCNRGCTKYDIGRLC